MKIRKTYAAIPQDLVAEFMRRFPTARLHTWPDTWSFSTNLKEDVFKFLGNDLHPEIAENIDVAAVLDDTTVATGPALSIALSGAQTKALEYLTRRITAGTIEAYGRDPIEKAQMQSALKVLKLALRAALARNG